MLIHNNIKSTKTNKAKTNVYITNLFEPVHEHKHEQSLQQHTKELTPEERIPLSNLQQNISSSNNDECIEWS